MPILTFWKQRGATHVEVMQIQIYKGLLDPYAEDHFQDNGSPNGMHLT